MSRLPRLLAPVTAVAALAVAVPAAHAATTASFANGTVEITDPGPSSPTVHLVATPTDPSHLADTRVFIGGDGSTPYVSVGPDGIRDAQYDDNYDGQLSTLGCSVYDSTRTTAADIASTATSFSADLPKGDVIAFESAGVVVSDLATDASCDPGGGFHGVVMDWPNEHQTIDGFSWDAPAAPAVATQGGRRSVTLSFDQERGTQYDIYRVVDGVRQATPFVANVRGAGTNVPVVIEHDPNDQPLDAGTAYAFQVQATRLFNVWSGADMTQPTSPFSAVATVSTAVPQAVRFLATPAASTTDRTAQITWAIDNNNAGEAPYCVLDQREVACTTTGVSLSSLTLGAHRLTVYPADGEQAFPVSWTVVAAPPAAAPAAVLPVPAAVPQAPALKAPAKNDADGDGIVNSWLVGGKPAAAPHPPKATVNPKAVTLTLPAAKKGVKKVRVYRAEGKGAFVLVTTVPAKGSKVTDKKVKPGHSYVYKTVSVNAKGQQSAASKPVSAKVPKKAPKKK